MPFDAHKNLAISAVATAPSPGASGLTLTVTAGHGVRFPAVPFNATVWPSGAIPTPANAELVRVTAMTGDQVTAMLRAQEGTTARAILVGDQIAATVSVKALTDLEVGTNFPNLGTAGHMLFSTAITDHFIAMATADGADTGSVTLGGGGPAVGGSARAARGAQVSVYGNEYAGFPGNINVQTGDLATSNIRFQTYPDTLRGIMHASGGFSWGNSVDPGAGSIGLTGQLVFASAAVVRSATPPGADTQYLHLTAGGAVGRSAYINILGKEYPGAANNIDFVSNGGSFSFQGAVMASKFHSSGGVSLGSTTDPGAGNLAVAGNISEKGRPLPLGHWESHAALIPAGWTGDYFSTRVGQSLTVVLAIGHTALPAQPPPVAINLPYPVTIAPASFMCGVYQGSAWVLAQAHIVYGSMGIYPGAAAFVGGSTYITLNFTLPV